MIGCCWVYKIKAKFDGSIEWYKVRLVAKGVPISIVLTMRRHLPQWKKMTTVCTMIAVASIRQRKIFQMDVKNAFFEYGPPRGGLYVPSSRNSAPAR